MSFLYNNPQLKTKCQENSTFRQLMNQNQKNYEQKLQQSFYSDLSKVNHKYLQITSLFIDETNLNGSKIYSEKKHILYVYSHFQPENPAELHKYFLYFIHSFPEPNQPFHLIYVNSTQATKGKCWLNFKNAILQQLPLKYLLFMQKLVLVRPSFLDKASSIVQFGVQNKFLNSKLQRFDCLRSFFDSLGKNYDEIKKSLPIEVRQQDEPNLQNIVKAIPFSAFICNFNQNRTSYDSTGIEPQLILQSKKGENRKQEIMKQKGKNKGLQNYSSGELGIPLALELLIFYFTQIPIRCQTQGLFRKCTSIDDERQLIRQLQNENYEVLTAIDNEIAVASTIKRFLTSLEPPLIPYQNYDRLIIDHSLSSIISEIHSFPIINFMTLMHILKFLKDFIIPFSKKNLMTLQNVAICFAPCLMRSKQITSKQFILATINVEISKMILMNFEEIFGNSQKQRRISNKTYKLFRKNSKLGEDSPKKNKFHSQQNSPNNKQLQIKITPPVISCPQDFLQPVSTILQDERQSETEKYSERSSEHKIQQLQFQTNQNHVRKQSSGITLISTKEPNSNIYLSNQTEQTSLGMKKHKSQKRLLFPQTREESLSRKSDSEILDISEDNDPIQFTNQEGIQKLNKLRINRSRMGNK